MMKMRKTKIVCTMGPASANEKVLVQMINEGMNVARLNFSHNTHEYHQKTIDLIKAVRSKMKIPLSLLLDTKGPEIRVCTFENGMATLVPDATFTLTSNEVLGNDSICSITYDKLPEAVSVGTRILLDDGNIELTVKDKTATDVICEVVTGGILKNSKSINIPNIHIDLPYISENDEKDLIFGVKNDVDFVAASFVRCKEDVIAVRHLLCYHGGRKIKIISKIENLEGVNNFDEILEHSDGIMIARGDMGVEIAFEKLPGIQKRFIKKCYASGKMVITATQMLESMIHSPMPTRAEITDVANAVFDGTSAVMLSGESAIGDNPAHVVRVMNRILLQAEADAFDMDIFHDISHVQDYSDTTNAICDAACTTARDLHARAIIAVTKTGISARRVSKFRPKVPIVGATPEIKTFHQLALSWGVTPVLALHQNNSDDLFNHAIDCAVMAGLISKGDQVVITAGVPLNIAGTTNIIKVETV